MKKLIVLIFLLFAINSYAFNLSVIGGGQADSIGDVAAPEFSSASIAADGDTVTINFSDNVTGTEIDTFTLDCVVAGDPVALPYSSGSGTQSLVFTSGSTITGPDSCTLDFDGDPGEDDFEDDSGNDLADFLAEAVTNNSTVSSDYSDITFWLGWENCSPDCTTYTLGADDYTAGEDSASTRSGGALLTAGSALVGSVGSDIPTASDYWTFTDSTDGAWPTGSFRVGFKLYVTGGTDNAVIIKKRYDAVENFYIRCEDTGCDDLRVQYRNGDVFTYIQTNENIIPNATEVFVEVSYDVTADTMELFVDGVSKGTDTTPNTVFTSGGNIQIGETDGVAVDFWIDNIMISDDYTRDLNALKDLTTSPID